MAKAKKPFYRYCLVPQCKNTIRSTPDKVFFPVPRNAKIRKKWCKVIRRDEVSPMSCLYCCEEHFNVEEDTANYVQYNIMKEQGEKVTLRLKEGVVPHIFRCQKRNMLPSLERMGAIKRQRLVCIYAGVSVKMSSYKKCTVPMCTSTTIKYPDKLFIHVPKGSKRRKQWLQLAHRDSQLISDKSAIFFCQDHFDLPNDMENYLQYSVMGSVSKIRMKQDCCPSKFECQPYRIKCMIPPQPRSAVSKRWRRDVVQEIVSKETTSGIIINGDEQLSSEDVAPSSSTKQTHIQSSARRPSPSQFFVPINLRQVKQEFVTVDHDTLILGDPLNVSPMNFCEELELKTEGDIKDEPFLFNTIDNHQTIPHIDNIKIESLEDVEAAGPGYRDGNKALTSGDLEETESAEDISDEIHIEGMKLADFEVTYSDQLQDALAGTRSLQRTLHTRTHGTRREGHTSVDRDHVDRRSECGICGKKYRKLKLHIRMKHSEERPLYVRQYALILNDMSKFIKSQMNLDTLRTHTREKPFVCEIYGKKNTQRFIFNHHLKIHPWEISVTRAI